MVKLKASFDYQQLTRMIDKLDGPLKESLARRMGVSGGRVLRDEARLRAPHGGESRSWNPGLLKSAIYVAYNDEISAAVGRHTYVVSWNRTLAPHGHLVEFGHWQPYTVRVSVNGNFVSNIDEPLSPPKWVPAYPFLRPAFDGAKRLAATAAIKRGRVELPILLRGGASDV